MILLRVLRHRQNGHPAGGWPKVARRAPAPRPGLLRRIGQAIRALFLGRPVL